MFRVLRFAPTATVADVARSICRTPARHIALVFAPGQRTRLADAGQMDALAALCREHHKDATIVGGDELLRASAVARGLPAAVTLEDWRDAQPSRHPRRHEPRPDGPTRLSALPRAKGDHAEETEEGGDAFDDGFELDPPEYVRELVALFHPGALGEAGSPAREPSREASREPIRLRRPFVVAARASVLPYDIDSGDRLRAISEDDEERLTATIRRSSGLDATLFAASWPASRGAASPESPKGSR